MTALSDVVSALAHANCKPAQHGNSYVAFCPVHEVDGHGHKPSLSVAAGDKVPVVIHCHAGCAPTAVFKALGIEPNKTSNDRRSAGAGTRKRIVTTYPYRDASGHVLFEKVRYEPKDFRIRHRDASGAEVWKLPPGIEPPLYRLPDVQAAIVAGEPVYVTEGEKDADRLVAAGLCATTNFDGAAKGTQKAKWRDSYTAALAGADVVLIPDHDEPGTAHMGHVAAALAGTALVRMLELPGLSGAKGDNDLSDWLDRGHTVDELKALAANASHQPDGGTTREPPPDHCGAVDDKAEIARLAALNLLDYDRERTAAAKRMGCRGDTLDRLVRDARGEPDKATTSGGAILEFPAIEPWPAPVDGAALLNDLSASVKQFMSLPSHAAAAIALWTVNSYIVVTYGHIAASLAVTSPEKRCGKSTLLNWLYLLADRPLLAANITAAAVFRTVDAYHPTLIIDEADSFLGESGDELRGILNSGHSRHTAFVIRVCGDEMEPRRFSTWGCKAIALIGKLDGRFSTLADRSIEIQLRRKLPTEKLMKLRHAGRAHFEELARRCARFAADHGAKIGAARPDIPDTLNDRAQDNWEPLLAIADVAGGNWPRLARTVALALSGGADTSGGDGIGVQLLTDLRRYFDGGNATSYPTETLLGYLTSIDDAPWPTYAKGKPMTARHLARLLHPYGILPQTLRFPSGLAKGYPIADFADAFSRYLPDKRNSVTSQTNSGCSPDSLSVTDSGCYGYEDGSLASQQAGCDVVTDKSPMSGTDGGGVADDDDDVVFFE